MISLKSAREIEIMRRANIIVAEVLQALKERVAPGVTTLDLDAVAEELTLKKKAIPAFKGYSVAGRVFPRCLCVSINEEIVHGIPSNRALREGDIVSIDTGCKFDGWCGDAAITHPVGKVTPEVQRLLDVTRGVLMLAIDLMGKKSKWSEVAAEMGKFVRDSNFSVVESFVGHGIGREMHEDPQVPNFVSPQLRRNGDFALEIGGSVTLLPGSRIAVREDGVIEVVGVHIAETA